MKVVIFDASKIIKSKLQIFSFEHDATLNESGHFDIVIYPGQLSLDSNGVILKTADGFSGHVIKISFAEFSSMVIQ